MKNKIKKVLVSIPVFFMGLISKVFATSLETMYGVERDFQTKYGVSQGYRDIQTAYGIENNALVRAGLSLGRLVLPIILLIVGLFVVFNKKITKKVKIIVISSLTAVSILGVLIINYFISVF